jgi:hypothetical protein
VLAVEEAIDLMAEELRKVSFNANLFGLLRLKGTWSRIIKEEWFSSLCLRNDHFRVIRDWFGTVSRGLKN